ncbi:T9SS type A sorting domain-containing protein [bacterium]|nr:T9SS type A sorting domain-containing protein [bacterium]
MRKVLFVFALLILVTSVYAFDVEDYMPLTVGNWWTTCDSSDYGVDTTTSEIIGTTTLLDYLTYLFQDRGAESLDTSYMQIRPDGLYSIEWNSDMGSYWVMRVVADPFNIGNEWEVFLLDTNWAEGTYTYFQKIRMTSEVVRLEDVNVPAGFFRNCVQITMVGYYIIRVMMGSTEVYSDSSDIGEHSMWFAEGVGPVKFYDFEAEDSMEIFSELLAYNCSGIDETPVHLPDELSVRSYPNPFNSSCRIEAPVGSKISIYDLHGESVETGAVGSEGLFLWQPERSTSSGVYFAKVIVGNQSKSLRILYLK